MFEASPKHSLLHLSPHPRRGANLTRPCEINLGIANCSQIFAIFLTFASFSEFSDPFGPVWTCSDLLGCIWVHSDASGCILRRLEHFGNFQKMWSEKLVFLRLFGGFVGAFLVLTSF